MLCVGGPWDGSSISLTTHKNEVVNNFYVEYDLGEYKILVFKDMPKEEIFERLIRFYSPKSEPSKSYKGHGNAIEQKHNMALLYDFDKQYKKILNEIGMDDKGFIGSHKLEANISVSCINNKKEYKLVGLDVNQLLGCGCWSGIILEIEEV